MNILNKLTFFIVGMLLLVSCTSKEQFQITADQIAGITKETTVADIETLFTNDSIVVAKKGGKYADAEGTISIYEKGGVKLLSIDPKEANDQASTVEVIRVFDNRYQTDKGISLSSTFKDITDAHTIKRIHNLLDSVVLFLENSPVFITIDKKHMPGEFMFDTSRKVELTNIPDDAPIKYMMIGW